MRFAVYDDHVYWRDGEEVWTDRSFPVFIAAVGAHLDRCVVLGRLADGDGRGARQFVLPRGTEFAGLPHYESLARPRGLVRSLAVALRRYWQVLDEVDGVWLLGPHPLGALFGLLALVRRRRLVLGVRQELPRYARTRHPGRRTLHVIADLLEATWHIFARVGAVVVVGPELARRYRNARRLHEANISMVRDADIDGPAAEAARDYDGDELRALSVGRLDTEKNALMLADVLARLVESDRRWKLVVCGTGPLAEPLAARAATLGVADRLDMRGYVSLQTGLLDVYRDAHAFLHVSWTEGVPQVLFEAFATRTPAVATAVGGVPQVAGGGEALLIEPDEPQQAAAALERIATQAPLRRALIDAGLRRVERHTLEAEAAAVARFLTAAA